MTYYIFIWIIYSYFIASIGLFKDALTDFVSYKNLKVKVVINNVPELGSFSTLKTVLKVVPKKSTIILNHIDIPILNTAELNKIISTENDVVIPHFKNKNGHPIKLSADIWNTLLDLDVTKADTRLDIQLKKINPIKISTVEVFDRAITLNLNSKNDWNSFLENQ